MSGRIRVFKQAIVQTNFRLDSIRSRHPMQGTFHLPVTCRSGTATGIHIIRTMNCRDISFRVFLHAFTLHDISPLQAHFVTRCHPEEFLRSVLHKIIPLDIQFARERNHSCSGRFIFRIVLDLHGLGLSFRVIVNHHPNRIQHGHHAGGNLVQMLPNTEFQ